MVQIMGWLTIPWTWSGLLVALWAFAPTYVYHLQFVTTGKQSGIGTAEQQDAASYIGFLSVSLLLVLIGLVLTWRLRYTWKLCAQWRQMIKPLLLSSVLMIPWYIATTYLYGNHRYEMPYDSNWAAIGGIASIGFIHFLFATFLMHGGSFGKPPAASA